MEDSFENPRYPGEFGDRKHYNRLVFISSPYRPESDDPAEQAREILRNIKLAKIGCRIAVERGCAPFAPHLLYPQFLDEHDPEARKAGMKIGLQFLELCDEMWVLGRKITDGMAEEIAAAKVNVTVQNPCLLQDDLSIPGKRGSQCLVSADTVLSARADI